MAVKKDRIPIPSEVSAEVLFLSDRTCCVCNFRGKSVQIHHIDENPSNNKIENLSVLCLECHNDTLIKGGFGRKLDANQVLLYRNNWLARVAQRKHKADELASIQTLTGVAESNIVVIPQSEYEFEVNDDPKLLAIYLQKILAARDAQYYKSQSKWDSGITTEMNEGNSDMIDFYQEILTQLATFYPAGHFNGKPPELYFKEYISSRFSWFWLMLEPQGENTGGRYVSTVAGSMVMSDLEQMIHEMVASLMEVYQEDHGFLFEEWIKEWDKK